MVTDEDKKRLDVLKNIHGHSSDSTVQNLLYSQNNGNVKYETEPSLHLEKALKKQVDGKHVSNQSNEQDSEERLKKNLQVFKNRNSFGHSSDSTVQNLLYTKKDETNQEHDDVIIQSAKSVPLKTQISVSNQSSNSEIEVEKKHAFKNRNNHGHSSDSTIQGLLYTQETPKITSKKPILESILQDQYIQNQRAKEKNKQKVEKAEFYSSVINEPLLIEEEQKKLASKFRTSVKMNKEMHATKSTIEKKIFDPELYKTDYNYDEDGIKGKNFANWAKKEYNWDEIFSKCVKPYDDNFNLEFNLIYDNILLDNQRNEIIYDEEVFEKPIDNDVNDMIISESNEENSILFSFSYINVDEMLKRLLIRPIEIQTNFVNKCLVNYFLQQLSIEKHFIALRKYFLFEDCEFAFTFVSYLCSKIFSTNEQRPEANRKLKMAEIFNPINIHEALNVAKSSIKSCKLIENLSICINEESSDNLQESQNTKADDSSSIDNSGLQYCSEILNYFNNFELKYTLPWPLNIVITDLCLKKYNQVFCFLLQIKFCHLILNNIWLSLKRVGK